LKEKIESKKQADTKSPAQKLVIRVWGDVFLGARETGSGNPGLKNRDYHYHEATQTFLGRRTFEETEAENPETEED